MVAAYWTPALEYFWHYKENIWACQPEEKATQLKKEQRREVLKSEAVWSMGDKPGHPRQDTWVPLAVRCQPEEFRQGAVPSCLFPPCLKHKKAVWDGSQGPPSSDAFFSISPFH